MPLISRWRPWILFAATGFCLAIPSVGRAQESAFGDSLKAAETLFFSQRYQDAEPALRRLLPQAEDEFGPSSERVLRVLNLLVASLYQNGKGPAAETLPLALRGRDLSLALFGPGDPRTATPLSNLGVVRTSRGELAAADSIFTEVVRVRERQDPPNPRGVAVALNMLAAVRHTRADYSGAIPLNRRALEIMAREFGGGSPQTLTIRSNLANQLSRTGDYGEARSLLDTQIAILDSLGMRGEQRAEAYEMIAHLDALVGDDDEALRLYNQVLALREEALRPGHPMIADTWRNLGGILLDVGRTADAGAAIARGRALWAAEFGPEDGRLADYDQLLGQIARREGDLSEARRYFQLALESHEKTLGEDSPKAAGALADLADLSIREGRYAEARTDLTRAIEILSTRIDAEHPRVGEASQALAEVYLLDGRPAKAFDEALAAEEILQKDLRRTMRSLPERQALLYARRRASNLDLVLSLLPVRASTDQTIRAWEAVIRARALVLDEMAARHHPIDPGSFDLWAAYERASTRLANLYLRAPDEMEPDAYPRVLEEARRDVEEAQRKLSRAGVAEERIDPAGEIGWGDVQRSLPPGSAMLAYVLYRPYSIETTTPEETTPRYRAFVLPAPGADPVCLDLGDAARIDGEIAAWKGEISFGALRADRGREESARAYTRAATALRESVWDPVAAPLARASRVFVVPAGQIHLVNLAALPLDDGSFLIESGQAFHQLTSEREIARRPVDETGGGALVMGAPDFDEGGLVASGDPGGGRLPGIPSTRIVFRGERPDCNALRSVRFGPLPGSLQEARDVAARWEAQEKTTGRSDPGAVHLLTGRGATEEAFKRMAPGSAILHLATHGYFLNGDCPSGLDGTRGIGHLIPASPGDGESAASVAPPPRNPLLLCGLALAGANRRDQSGPNDEDGILTAQEIAALDLSRVRLAVLSACETGAGEVRNGEGIFGLQRAFRVAGARTVITSLWSVQDEATRHWMDAFYRAGIDRGLPASEAARAAGLSVLRDRRARGEDPHPFYWAAFVASGDWR